jgi:hypothetical protein
MILALIDVAKEKGDNERVKAYWQSYHSLNTVIASESDFEIQYQ